MRLLRKYLLTTGLLLVPHSTLAQNPTVPNAVSSLPKYDDSAGGLKHQLEDAMKVAKNHDRKNLVSLTSNMVLPDPHLWFTKVFGAQIGVAYEKQYAPSTSQLSLKLADNLETFTTQHFTDLKVVRFTKACDDNANETEYPLLLSRQTGEPISVVNFGQGNAFYSLKFFAYIDGAFRFVGDLKPYPVPDIGTTLEMFSRPRILKRVSPTYPDEARREHLQGDVVLDAMVKKDGTTAVLHVLKGRCILAEPAIKAVQQWLYSPTMVDGNPADVEANITITFAMH